MDASRDIAIGQMPLKLVSPLGSNNIKVVHSPCPSRLGGYHDTIRLTEQVAIVAGVFTTFFVPFVEMSEFDS